MLHRRKKKLCFKSERDLEDFVWVHLNDLFALKGLKRQHMLKQDVCDILAIDEIGALTVLELKNTADRYIVQQLTRYYDRLIAEKPLAAEIDYNLPIRLIAIAPAYHEHNLIDQKYSALEIEFLTYEISELEDKSICFILSDLKKARYAQVLISSSQEHKEDSGERSEKELKQEKIDRILHHYVRVRCAHKLGLPDVSPEELAASKAKFTAKGSKFFKIRLNEYTPSGSPKFVSVRVPSTIGVYAFMRWVGKNVPKAVAIKLSGHTWDVGAYCREELNQVDEEEPNQADFEAVDAL
ncbi:MAG: DUF91 domain-containing protein [Tildeniella nuda ZEHNDER 1965/U140]|jgi:hypothetical protein|nr:DUF91 domain-containing protein [Tildeniella nuda ZEHNDER 1965/U140]